LRSADGRAYQVRCSPEIAASLAEALEMFSRDPKRAEITAQCQAAAEAIRSVSR